MDVTIRPAIASDAVFLTDMVVVAAFWRPDGPPGSRDDVMSDPKLASYISGWPLPRDAGVVAAAERPVGAAWYRFFPADNPGYGFVTADVPEVTMGVAVEWRGQGVGRSLLDALIATARGACVSALSLSVESDNYALALYESLGFEQVALVADSPTLCSRL